MVENTKTSYDEVPPLVEATPLSYPVAPSAPMEEEDIVVAGTSTVVPSAPVEPVGVPISTTASVNALEEQKHTKQVKRAAGVASGILGL
jgi:hypothetical protein